jgi:hypothetical protein
MTRSHSPLAPLVSHPASAASSAVSSPATASLPDRRAPSALASLSRFAGVASLFGAAALGACAADPGDDSDSAVAELAIDAGDSGQAESSLLAASLDGIGLGVGVGQAAPATPADLVAAINARLAARFSPAGCATSTSGAASLTVTFTNCTGPRGLRAVNGTFNLAVTSVSGTSATLTAKATDFQIGAATLNLDLTATYAVSGTGYSLAVETRSGGVGPFGHALDHSGSYQATWDAGCTNLAGTWSTALDGRTRSINADLRRCVASCATGTVTRTTRDGRTITITLDGSNASWTSSTGRTGTLPLRCGR